MTHTPTTRKPTGIPAAPLIMVSGFAKSGKSLTSYKLACSPRIHRTFVFDLGEGSADEYGGEDADPPYEIVEWGASWSDLADSIRWAIAQKAPEGKLNAIIVDSGTELWFELSARANKRARSSKKAVAALKEDPNAEIDTAMTFWNDAKETWARCVTPLKLAPHVVGVVLARSEMVAEVINGAPTKNKIVSYQVEKTLQGLATAHVTVDMDHKARLVEARSKHVSVGPKGQPLGDNPLAEVLELLSPSGAFGASDARKPVDDGRDDPEMKERIDALWTRIKACAGTDLADELKAMAKARNRKLTESDLASDIDFFVDVRAYLDEHQPTTQPPLADIDRENSEHNQ